MDEAGAPALRRPKYAPMTSFFTAKELALPGVLLITPRLWSDGRGLSATVYEAQEFAALGITSAFVQDYVSFSKKNVIRGLHYQRAPHAQDKLIRCATGRVFDVVADHNASSPTFGKYLSVELNAQRGEMLFVPGRYAHGFCVLSDEGASVEYKLSGGYHPENAGGVRFDEPLFNIRWPVKDPVLSERDRAWPLLSPAPAL